MSDLTTRPYGGRFAAMAMAAGGILYGVTNAFYWLVFPDSGTDTAKNVDVAASHLGAWRVETILFALTHLLLLPAVAGLIVALGRRKPRVAAIGGTVAVAGLFFATVHLWHYNAFFGALAGAGVDAEQVRPVVDALDKDPFVMASFAIWILGWLVGLLVLAYGAWRAAVVPLWVPLALTGGQVLDVVSTGVALKLVVSVLMAAGLLGLARGLAARRSADAPGSVAEATTAASTA